MEKFIKHIVGFRTNTKSKIIVALVYYSYCIYSIPSRSIVSSVIGFALPFIFFALKDKGDAQKKEKEIKSGKFVESIKPIEINKPIVLTKLLKRTVIAGIVVLLGLGMYSNSVQNKKDLVYAVEQKAIATKQAKIDVEAKRVADAKALEAKKIADVQAIRDKEIARLQVIEDTKIADEQHAKAESEAKIQAEAQLKAQQEVDKTAIAVANNSNSVAASKPVSKQTNSGVMVWLSATGSKYHSINNCGKMNPDNATQVTLEEAKISYSPCSKCSPPQ
ncbi:hypothetical protein G9F72_011150 [Clostridium estertheticum]|uniref:hypothetical protein n=1 Tax=Clostridium estertheticum TaxID=238834 RepID=UPI0013E97616|nr:hypothetical protein [Clostridium estertheticum]MBN4049354.1 hypothetical protein [bacterium AH-315-N14]MBZ9686881.1 hypothetical protein [Clostridium estertheticum]